MIKSTTTIALSGIDVPAERLRALRQEAVDVLAESMKRNGLIHPVTLRKRAGRGYWVVAGAHRLAAAEKLGWREIACVILDKYSEDEATLIEIDENLTRSELSPAERARHIKRRKAIYEKAHPETKNGATGKGRGKQLSQNEEAKERFTADTARKTGKSEAAVQRDATRAKRVEVLSEIINTSLDKGAELDALAKLPGAEQRDLAARAKAGEKVSARKPPKMDKLVEQALRLVAQMTAAERKIFLSKLEADTKPVIEPSPRRPPKIDPDVIKQAGNFHVELMNNTEEFCARIKQWHAANQIDEECHGCVVQALEMASMRLQETAQDIDDR
ncbi:ParB N-terminal domain-containing protein [Bradyrhizobium sp. 49]|uniref:ParB/RepB/Spo0J family partition protein n=1 Tax=unclassified Bradyrhizobium TaxID=2631580 RepID=UPI001FF751E2|nr:ParB N-terminal domain-containing protein [Bradyrhizobium sp. 84]MCK1375409.1 ParB N-terminal domain-containing protein [Bradyrhizobium sp. 49]MCK1418453.1 ParB N-terminal domain-containing protein [Bradyrhizobium sp. CW4]